EELNGDFFNGILYDPIIAIENDKAKATVTFVTPIMRWKTKLFLNFQKYSDAWKISRFEWDMG
ncbi:MAG: hypothetical protein GY707_12120, partial [Desulfobacteraceae bacterium]|nr:hypothetical protein [Desulfobacteraceae bacterium]